MTFTPAWRRFFLLIHVTTSVGFPGAVAGFLALAVVGATSTDAAVVNSIYVAMAVLTWDVIVPLAVASLVFGIVQSLGTPWGLVRYYWIIVKLVLTVIAVAVLLLQTQTIDLLAATALRGNLTGLDTSRVGMVLHGAGGLLVLMLATALSIYKPRGMTAYGSRKLQSDR
jgi:hypothetical protein